MPKTFPHREFAIFDENKVLIIRIKRNLYAKKFSMENLLFLMKINF